jgi:methylglyoxal/glyoxal reductase
MKISDTVTLNNGTAIPRFGLGVYQSGSGRTTEDAVRWALEAGYRHVDTASMYRNETEVGTAIRRAIDAGLVRREDVFVTTKLWNSDHGYDEALRAFDASFRRLGLDYIDLFLLHWPVPQRRRHSWRALERIVGEGRCRAIGVSNYMVRHLEELLGHAAIPPAVNQIELHPWCQQREVDAWCKAHGVAVVAYSPGQAARRHRQGRRPHARAGAAALVAPKRFRDDPEIDEARADRGKRRDLRLHARRRGDEGARRPQ